MQRRSFLQRAAQWVAAGTAVLVAKEAPAAPVALAKPAPSFMPSSMIKPYLDAHHQAASFDPTAECWKTVYTATENPLSVQVSRQAEEDLYGVYEQFAREMGKAQKRTQELQALSIFGG